MFDFKATLGRIGDTLVRHSPAILTGLGCAGVISTTALGCHATIKAKSVLEKYECIVTQHGPEYKKASAKERFLLTWKLYVPTVISGAASIACIIGANSVNSKRQAALASLYALSETALKDYKEEVVAHLKPKQLDAVQEGLVNKKLEDHPVIDNEVILTERGNQLCYDTMSSRYFRSDIETIRRIQNDINEDCIKSDWMTLNDFYFSLGLQGVKYGDEWGWSAADQLLDITFTSSIASNGEACIVVDYDVLPKYF